MEAYMETYTFERKGTGFLAKLVANGSPVAEYDNQGALTKIINAACLPVQECVPMMIARCMT